MVDIFIIHIFILRAYKRYQDEAARFALKEIMYTATGDLERIARPGGEYIYIFTKDKEIYGLGFCVMSLWDECVTLFICALCGNLFFLRLCFIVVI